VVRKRGGVGGLIGPPKVRSTEWRPEKVGMATPEKNVGSIPIESEFDALQQRKVRLGM